jgi:hypothetical protein
MEAQTKAAYKTRLAEAVEWLQGDGRGEKPVTAARIYGVNPGSIRTSIKRARRQLQKTHGGQNKILSNTQTKAIETYCYEQWEIGIGAIKQMVYAVICFLVGLVSQ